MPSIAPRKFFIKTTCGHLFHKKCFSDYFMHFLNTNDNIMKCPLCRTAMLIITHNNLDQNLESELRSTIYNREILIVVIIVFSFFLFTVLLVSVMIPLN